MSYQKNLIIVNELTKANYCAIMKTSWRIKRGYLEMEKEVYEAPEINVKIVYAEDIVKTSNLNIEEDVDGELWGPLF